MYQPLSAILVLLLLGGAGNEEKAKAILAKAAEAQGIVLEKKPAAYWMSLKLSGDSMEIWLQTPDRLRMQSKFTRDSRNYETLVVVRGDKGWLKFSGGVIELDKDKISGLKNGIPISLFDWVPADSKDLRLSYLGEKAVGDQPCEGVSTIYKSAESISYFNKKTGLLVSTEGPGFDPANPNNKIKVETRFSEYKKFDNVMFPTKIKTLAGGKGLAQMEIESIRLLDKFDDKLFQEPKDD